MSDLPPPPPRDGIEGDRSASQVAYRHKPWLSNRSIAIFGVCFMAIILILVYRPFTGGGHSAEKEKPPHVGVIDHVPPTKPDPAAVQKAAVDLGLVPPPKKMAEVDKPALVPPPGEQHGSSGAPSHAVQSYAAAPAPQHNETAAGQATKPERTSVVYKGTTFAGTKAGLMGNTALTLMPGLLLCVMDTDMNTDGAGPFMCHLPGPAITDEGAAVLPRDTQIVGNYSSASTGQKRVVALTAQLITPKPTNGGDRCTAKLGGPLADSLGASGVPGQIDPHFRERFGPALLLTGLETLTGLGQAALSANGSTYLSFNSGNGATSLAHDVLQASINIPPTLIVHHDDRVLVWITEPIDFSDCYALHAPPGIHPDP